MRKHPIFPAALLHLATVCACATAAPILVPQPATPPPRPFGATPSEAQLRHAERAFYAFCHFTVDTFTDREWGTGGESELVFNPTAFDAGQIVKSIKASGAKGVILTCKHHDGFCLWPTSTTEHNISAGPYKGGKGGKGDVVREMSDACKKNNFEFGVYVSPWDRNHKTYGGPDYPAVYHKQIEELTSRYGKLFEIWFDGANGGSGYYQGKVGPVESNDVGHGRQIDPGTYYQWPAIDAILKKNQPGIIVFSDVGPGARWVGNENGQAPDPCRSTITLGKNDTWGSPNHGTLSTGTLHGETWIQAEADVSIRPGWFWHAGQNGAVRSPENLMGLYMDSIGHGATLNLNCPPDRRGLLHENDVASLKQFGEHLRATFARNLAAGAKSSASNIRGGDPFYGPQKLLDRDQWSAWVTDDSVHTTDATLVFSGEKTFNLIKLREDIRLGLRVEGVAVDAFVGGEWKELAKAESIGSCHLWRVPKTTTAKVRIRVTKSEVAPALSDFGLFLEPEFAAWIPPIGGDPNAAAKAK